MSHIDGFHVRNRGVSIQSLNLEYRSSEHEDWNRICVNEETLPVGHHYPDPFAWGVPDGSEVRIAVKIMDGSSLPAMESFHYRQGCGQRARYFCVGKVFEDELIFLGLNTNSRGEASCNLNATL